MNHRQVLEEIELRGGTYQLLSREDQLQLATIWGEAREKGDWERLASHCALIPSHRGYARLREGQEAGTFIDNQIMHLHITSRCHSVRPFQVSYEG